MPIINYLHKKGVRILKRLQDKGFTLIELMVVIAIIAILAIVGLTIFSGQQASARDARRSSDIDAISKALENHYVATIDQTSGTYTCPGSAAIIKSPGYCPIDASYFAGDTLPTDPGGQRAVYCYYGSYNGLSINKIPATTPWAAGPCPGTTDTGGTSVAGTPLAAGVGGPNGTGQAVNSWMVCALKETNPASGNYQTICQNSSQQ